MKLYPKARPVRIKLNVGGEEHSSLDSLRANFNVEEVLKLYASGGLQNWLRQINRQDILENLDKIKDNDSIIEKYRKCILVFFEVQNLDDELKKGSDNHNNKSSSIDLIVNSWYDYRHGNFENLLSNIRLLPPDTYYLSVNSSLLLIEKARLNQDSYSVSVLEEYIYIRVKGHLQLINKLRSRNIHKMQLMEVFSGESDRESNLHEETKNERALLSDQLSIEWNIEIDKVLEADRDPYEALKKMVNLDILKKYEKELMGIIEQIKLEDHASQEDLSESVKKKFCSMMDFIRSGVADINNYHIHPWIFESNAVVNLNTTGKSLHIKEYWYKLIGIVNGLDKSISMKELIENWSLLFLHIYLCYWFLNRDIMISSSSKRTDYFKLKHFLTKNKGNNGWYTLMDDIHDTCNLDTIKTTNGLRRKIMMSALMFGILTNDNGFIKDIYLKELHVLGYRPASLLLKLRTPENELEKYFISLDNLSKISYLAEHILDF